MKPVLVYDDDCGPCTAFASGGKRGERAAALGWSTPEAKRLMEAQFGKEFGFTLMLFADPRVYWGNEAAREYVRLGYVNKGFIAPLRKLVEWVYPVIVRVLNQTLHRQRLPEPPHVEGEEPKQGGSQPLTEEARSELQRITERYADGRKETEE